MRFADGKIIEHSDAFSLHKWASQALGFTGWLLAKGGDQDVEIAGDVAHGGQEARRGDDVAVELGEVERVGRRAEALDQRGQLGAAAIEARHAPIEQRRRLLVADARRLAGGDQAAGYRSGTRGTGCRGRGDWIPTVDERATRYRTCQRRGFRDESGRRSATCRHAAT